MLHLTFALALAAPFQPMATVAAATPAVTAPAAAPAAAVPGAPPLPGAAPPLPPDPVAMELATRFAAAIKCDPGKKDPARPLCAITRIGKDAIWTPGQSSTYVGLSVKVATGADLKKIGTAPLTTAVLHLAAGSGRLMPLAAATEGEKPQLQALLTDLQGQLKGDKKDALVVAPDLVNRLREERKKPRAALKLDKMFAEIAGAAPTRLYRADLAPVLGITTGPSPVYVTVETLTDGQQISIFPGTPIER